MESKGGRPSKNNLWMLDELELLRRQLGNKKMLELWNRTIPKLSKS